MFALGHCLKRRASESKQTIYQVFHYETDDVWAGKDRQLFSFNQNATN